VRGLKPFLAATAALLALGGSSAATSGPSLSRLAGQLVMSPVAGTRPDAVLLARVRAGQVGGVILFGANIGSLPELRALTRELQRAAAAGRNPPLLIAVDQEGGPVRRLRDAPPLLSAPDMGRSTAGTVRDIGAATGRALRAGGINLDLAPVADVPRSRRSFMLERAFGAQPAHVASLAAAFVDGVQSAGVAATAKHFPGLGTAVVNTDAKAVTIRASRAELLARLEPFRAAVAHGVDVVMLANASYRALDPSGLPAVLSRRIVGGLLRGTLGFRGVAITDTLAAPGPAAYPDAPVRTIEAGGDVLLFTRSEAAAAEGFEQVLAAARSGRLSRARLELSYERIVALKRRLGG
jgi:beta-N-acetylhexosaminidase